MYIDLNGGSNSLDRVVKQTETNYASRKYMECKYSSSLSVSNVKFFFQFLVNFMNFTLTFQMTFPFRPYKLFNVLAFFFLSRDQVQCQKR